MPDMSDDELRALVVRALEHKDAEATAKLIAVFEERVPAALNKYAPACGKNDVEDAMSDVVCCLWKALPRLVDRAVEYPWAYTVEYPWAYITAVIRNEAFRVGKRLRSIRAREVPLEEVPLLEVLHERADEGAAVVDNPCDRIAQWMATVDPTKREAGSVFVEAALSGVPVKQVLRERYPDDPIKQNRIERQIARGKGPGGFIVPLRGFLWGEED